MLELEGAGHFGHRTLRDHKIGAEVSGHFGTGTEVSIGHFGSGPFGVSSLRRLELGAYGASVLRPSQHKILATPVVKFSLFIFLCVLCVYMFVWVHLCVYCFCLICTLSLPLVMNEDEYKCIIFKHYS